MAIKELTRLRRLKLESMSESRLRTHLKKAIENLEAENENVKKLEIKFNLTSVALSESRIELELLRVRQRSQASTINDLQKNIVALETALTAAKKGRKDSPELPASVHARLSELAAQNTVLSADLHASRKLLKKLNADRKEQSDSRKAIRTSELFAKFTSEIETAAKSMNGDFVIDDIEVDVKGAMGLKDDDVVVGLDYQTQTTDENATRIRFALKRKAKITKVE